jgi:hypothetical protein
MKNNKTKQIQNIHQMFVLSFDPKWVQWRFPSGHNIPAAGDYSEITHWRSLPDAPEDL